MDESLLSEFEQLKISALSKLKFVKNDIGQVTLGPNSVQHQKPKLFLDKNLQKNSIQIHVKQNNNNDIQNILINSEIQRMKEVRNIVQNHIDNMEKFSKHNQIYHHKQWLDAQEEFIKYQRQKDIKILEASDEFDRTVSIEHARTEKQYKDLEEQRKLREQELKMAEERKKILHYNIEKIKKYHQNFHMVYQSITVLIQNCSNKEKLREHLGGAYEQLKNLPNQIDEIRLKCKNSTVTDEDVKRGLDIVIGIEGLCNNIKEIVDKINENDNTTLQKTGTSEGTILAVPNQQLTTQEPKVESTVETNNFDKNDRGTSEKIFTMSKYISVNNFKFYCEIINFLESHSRSFQELEKDISQKQFKFDCKKAVNIPVNALSGVSSEHILDKYNRLYNLLKGQNVEINSNILNASKHPQGIAFCKDLLAKKLVLQGDLMVSSNPESAFCYGSLIISLWNDIPSFGHLVLAHFYTVCPYLVPYNIPREVGQTDEQFYKQCGYQYIDGQIESQDKFLKRITGESDKLFFFFLTKLLKCTVS